MQYDVLYNHFKSIPSEETIFYKLLRSSEYEYLYRQASDKQFIICVPPNLYMEEVLKELKTSSAKLSKFIKNHLLSPSNMLVGLHNTEGGLAIEEKEALTPLKQQKAGYIRDIEIIKGFPKPISAKVLKEETVYNQQYKPFKLWTLDKCFIENVRVIEERVNVTFMKNVKSFIAQQQPKAMKQPETLEEFEHLLNESFPEAIRQLQLCIKNFNTTYVLLKGDQEPAVLKINSMYQQIVDETCSLSSELSQDDSKALAFKNSVNSLLLSGVYSKLFGYWKDSNKEGDELYLKAMTLLTDVTFQQLEIPAAFHVQQDQAIATLQQLSSHTSCFEKLKCIKGTCDAVLAAVNAEQKKLKHTSGLQEQQALTTDELIPILTYVIIKSKEPHLYSNMKFMVSFQIDELSATEYGFVLVTLEAAIEYMKKEAKSKNKQFEQALVAFEKKNSPAVDTSSDEEEEVVSPRAPPAEVKRASTRNSVRGPIPTEVIEYEMPKKKTSPNTSKPIEQPVEEDWELIPTMKPQRPPVRSAKSMDASAFAAQLKESKIQSSPPLQQEIPSPSPVATKVPSPTPAPQPVQRSQSFLGGLFGSLLGRKGTSPAAPLPSASTPAVVPTAPSQLERSKSAMIIHAPKQDLRAPEQQPVVLKQEKLQPKKAESTKNHYAEVSTQRGQRTMPSSAPSSRHTIALPSSLNFNNASATGDFVSSLLDEEL